MNFWVHSILNGSLKNSQTFEVCRRPSGLPDIKDRRSWFLRAAFRDTNPVVVPCEAQVVQSNVSWRSGGLIPSGVMNMEAVGDYRAAESFRCETEEQHFFLVRPSIIERASPVRNEAIMEGNKSSDGFMNGLMGGFYTQQQRVNGAMWRWITQNSRQLFLSSY